MKPSEADIAVCVGTFGDPDHWTHMVAHTAAPSVHRQTLPPAAFEWVHGPNLHEARNLAAEAAVANPHVNWLCFLDADDELDDTYLEAMHTATTGLAGDWLLQPATLGVHPDGHEDPYPVVIPPKPLLDGNFMVIGTVVRADQFQRVGGFHEWPIYEDWDLWIRCTRDGARHRPVADAIYRVHVNPNSRNNGQRDLQIRTYNQIRNHHGAARR